VNRLTVYLENDKLLDSLKTKNLEFSKQFNQRNYAINLIEIYNNQLSYKPKVYLQKEGFIHLGQSWICDKLREEFLQFSKFNFVDCIEDAEIVWLISPWAFENSDLQFLEGKFVITTIHHIDIDKLNRFNLYFKHIQKVTNRFHSICAETTLILKTLTNKEIVELSFWINESVFFSISNKASLKPKYKLPENAFLVGSFQKDSEGKSKYKPKLSKGPDILFNILLDMKRRNLKIHVILTGFRRDYLIRELDRVGISYSYFEMVNLEQLNELYNCLDLYVVSSRVEGGPRAILECALAKVPIISTKVGIAELILSKESLFEWDNYETYYNAKPDVLHAYSNANQYAIRNYMSVFEDALFK
jgi:hypothetical protein